MTCLSLALASWVFAHYRLEGDFPFGGLWLSAVAADVIIAALVLS